MKVYVFPADQTGCGHFRAIWPAAELRRQGCDVYTVSPEEQKRNMAASVNKHTGEILDVKLPVNADVIVLQRVTSRTLADAIPVMQRRHGVRVVVDIDDDLARIDPANPAWTHLHPTHGDSDHSWQHCQRACETADWVTCTTDALARRYAPHGRVSVIKNYVPDLYLDLPHEDSSRIAWAGSFHSHPRDLDVIGSSISRLVNEGYEFRVIGSPHGVGRALKLPETWADGTGPVEQADWPASVAQHVGVGIAPLADTLFNAAKSWLKPLEYAAVGAPCVVSPRADYLRLHNKYGIGRLADKPKQWYREIKLLLDNPGMRADIGAESRERVREHLTISKNAHHWWEAWEKAYSHSG